MADSSVPFLDNVRSMDGSRRFLLIGALVVLAIGIGFVGRWASTPTYVTLFHDMELKEVGAVGENLAKASIPYRLGPGGTDIEVPVADVARARVALAKSGLPANGRPGLELFDKPSWGMTDFTQRVTYQRALEGELARTIGEIQGVERAEVHLLLPAQSAIRRQEHEAGASVVLSLKGGTPLSGETVQGITYIVSNSVEGLAADNVAVMDNTGRVLSLPSSGGGGAGLTGRQLDVQHGIESRTVDKIENLVATVVGVGRVRAQVAAQVSFDQVDATTETYNPDGQVLQTEQRSEGGPADGGTPQTIVSNQYQNSRRVEKSTSAAGRLCKLTVAVLVDEKSLRAGEKATELADVEAMVRNAVGIDSTRGDRLSVLAVPFEPVQVGADPKSARPPIDPIAVVERVSHPLVGVVAIVVMLLIAIQLRSLLAPPKRLGTAGAGLAKPPVIEEMAALPPPEDTEVIKLRNRLKHETNERPEVTAQVLKAWLAELMAARSGKRGRNDLEGLSGAQKGAVLCMALGVERSSKILQLLTSREVESISKEIASLPVVESEKVANVLAEFQHVSRAVDSVAHGGVDYAQEILESALGTQKAKAILDRIQEQLVDTGLKRLRNAQPEVLAGILRGEHPQTIALILAHLDARQSAGVIQGMESELAAEVLYRIARMDKISPEMLLVVESGLSSKTDLSLSEEMTLSGGPQAVAKLLNLTGGTLEKQLLEGIETRSNDIADQIKSLMFVFEDLMLIDARGIQRILRDVDAKDLALALKAASNELKQHIRSNMSERAGQALEEEIEMLGPVRVKDVEAAHARIIEIVRLLSDSGEVMIEGRGGGDDIIQ